MTTLICAYGTIILTNCEPSKLVEECFYVLPGKDTDYISVNDHMKNSFVVTSGNVPKSIVRMAPLFSLSIIPRPSKPTAKTAET